MGFENVAFITSDVKESPRFFRSFDVHGAVRSAVLRVTGLGLYTVFINGKKAGDAYLAPGFNDYDGYLRYQELDVTGLLSEGENKIEVFLGNGWYKGRFGLMSMENTWGDLYLLAAELNVHFADGSELEVVTDESWMASESCIRANSIYDGEVRDDTAVIPDPVCCKFARDVKADPDGSPEQQAAYTVADAVDGGDAVKDMEAIRREFASDVVLEGPAGKEYHVVAPLCPPVRAKHERKPVLITSPKGETILDFGQNMAGIVRIHNRLPKGVTIHLTFGEVLVDGCFCNSNYNSAVGGYTYTSDGVEKDVEPLFTFFGFRYALVEVQGNVTVDPADFTALVLYTDLQETMRVHTSNPKLNQLLSNSLWGQRSNFLDVPTDCPQRSERLGWTGDAQVFANTACFHMNCEDFYRKYIHDLRFDQLSYLHGDIAMFSPCQKDGAPGGPAWADVATILPWTLYEHYGHVDRLQEAYPMMKDYMEVLIGKDRREDDDRILKSGHAFGDWLALDGASPNAFKGGTDDVYVRTVYYWCSADILAKAAQVLGYEEDHKRYCVLADEIRAALIREFFSPAGRLCIDTQTGYVLALHFGLYPNKEKLIEGFKARLSRDMLKLKTGFVGTGFLLQTLFENGMEDYAYRMIFTEEFPGWLYAVNLGATTIWERWNSVMPDGTLSPTGMNSLNHYSYGLVSSVIYSYVAGLKNAAPGWKKAVIEPHPNYRLRQIDLAFDSPAGTWKSGWEILSDGSLHFEITVPEGTTATIRLPHYPAEEGSSGANCEISRDGVCEAGPGTYTFDYMPDVDFFHPYDGDTFIADIAADENAVNALKTAIPGAFDQALAGVNNDAACNLAGAIFFSPIPDLPKKIDEILRGVRYEVH